MGSLLAQLGMEIERNAKHRTPESAVANILTQAIDALKEARGAPPAVSKPKGTLPVGSLESLAAARPANKRVWNCTASEECLKECEYGWAILKPIVCEDHQEDGMDKYIAKRRCGQGRACPKQPTFGWHGKSAVSSITLLQLTRVTIQLSTGAVCTFTLSLLYISPYIE